MNDGDRALVEEVLKAAGTVGQEGFAYMVHYQIIDGATSILGYAVVGWLTYLAFRKLFAWKAKNEYSDGEGVAIVKGFAIVALCALTFCTICGMQASVRQLLAPEGSAIRSVIGR